MAVHAPACINIQYTLQHGETILKQYIYINVLHSSCIPVGSNSSVIHNMQCTIVCLFLVMVCKAILGTLVFFHRSSLHVISFPSVLLHGHLHSGLNYTEM